jgi:hypothetical protein
LRLHHSDLLSGICRKEAIVLGFIVHLEIDCEVTKQQQDIFHMVLSNDGWDKVPGTECCWKTIFKDSSTKDAALNVAKHDVDRALKKAKIFNLKAVMQFEDGQKETFNLHI